MPDPALWLEDQPLRGTAELDVCTARVRADVWIPPAASPSALGVVLFFIVVGLQQREVNLSTA